MAIDASAFKWVADEELATRGLSVNLVVSCLQSTTTSFFSDMILSHESIKSIVFKINGLYGIGQPSHYGIISQLFQDVVVDQKEVIDLPMISCGDYLYVEDVVTGIFNKLTNVLDDHDDGHDQDVVVVLKSHVVTRDIHILSELIQQQQQDDDEGIYSPDINFINSNDEQDVVMCDKSIDLHHQPSTTTLITGNRARSVQQGIQRMVELSHLSTTTSRTRRVRSDEMNKQQQDKQQLYSTVTCTAGHQNFPNDWKFYNDDYNSIQNRICMFENICLFDQQLIYFQHEDEYKAPDYAKFPQDDVFVFLSLTGLLNIKIDVARNQSIPDFLLESYDNKTWFFTLASYSFNFAHVLMDEIFSVIGAMNIFNIPQQDVVLLYDGCQSHHDKVNLLDKNNPHGHPYDFEKPTVQICQDNMKYYSKLVFNQEAIDLETIFNSKRNICFKKFIIGQGYVLSSGFVDKQRPVVLRQGRDMILNNLGYKNLLKPKKLSIIVLPKKRGFYSSAWLTMCDDIKHLVDQDKTLSTIPLRCIPHDGTLSIKEEILLIQQATLIIAEHGTISFIALYANDGTVLLSVGNNKKLKDGQSLLYTSHLQVYYTAVEVNDTMKELIQFGLRRASENFNIPLEYDQER